MPDHHHDESSTDPRPTAMRTHLCGVLRPKDVGTEVRVCGWVARRREHGEHLAFVDLRDHTGVIQCVIDNSVDVRSEWVVAINGTVRLRPDGTRNDHLATGEVEIGDCTVEILNEAEPPPFSVDDRDESDEPVRLRHRYIDLRRTRMQSNLRLRSRVNAAIRAAMDRQGFCEVETPLLWAPTPEGSREILGAEPAPSRQLLRVAPKSPTGQAALDGRWVRPLLPNCRAACVTRICGRIASSNSPSSTWRPPSPVKTTSWDSSQRPSSMQRRPRRGNDPRPSPP